MKKQLKVSASVVMTIVIIWLLIRFWRRSYILSLKTGRGSSRTDLPWQIIRRSFRIRLS